MSRTFVVVLAAITLAACSGSEADTAPPPAPPVTVAKPLSAEVRDWDDYVGRFEAVQSVDVRPRATGYLQQVHFTEGQYVRAGQTLFTIDARPSQASLAQAKAQLARAEALLVNARTELTRSETLAASQAASQEEVEQRRAAVRAGQAEVAAARANVDAQQLTVGFTTVRAPISGRISERLVDTGNSVIADQTVLTRIVSTDPIHFTFEGSEALLLKYQRSNSGAKGSPVQIRLADEDGYNHRGTIDFIDPIVNATGGTVRGRALVPNRNGFLKPGMVGRLQLAGSAPYAAVMVPDTAIITDASRRLLYVVDKDGMVAARAVELGPLVGDLRVIRAGLKADETVVISGIQRAKPGQKITPQPGKIEQSKPEAAANIDRTPPASSAEIVAVTGN